MSHDDDAALERVREVQGFDARGAGTRSVYLLLTWPMGRARRKYSLDLIFDGDRLGLQGVLTSNDGPAVCVGEGTVDVGVDDTVATLLVREIEVGDGGVKTLLRSAKDGMSLAGAASEAPQQFGPFSLRQQLYAASIIDAPGLTLYGVRARWATGVHALSERYLLLLAASVQDALSQLRGHFAQCYPTVDESEVIIELDDTRMETVAAGWSVFSWSRISTLDELAFIAAFALGPVVETS